MGNVRTKHINFKERLLSCCMDLTVGVSGYSDVESEGKQVYLQNGMSQIIDSDTVIQKVQAVRQIIKEYDQDSTDEKISLEAIIFVFGAMVPQDMVRSCINPTDIDFTDVLAQLQYFDTLIYTIFPALSNR